MSGFRFESWLPSYRVPFNKSLLSGHLSVRGTN
jgi:hypothetical protein